MPFAQVENTVEGKAAREERHPSGAADGKSALHTELKGEVWAGDVRLSIKTHGHF